MRKKTDHATDCPARVAHPDDALFGPNVFACNCPAGEQAVEAWRRRWREHLAPLLSDEDLERLRCALVHRLPRKELLEEVLRSLYERLREQAAADSDE